MYNPKLPVTGISVLAIGLSSISRVVLILLLSFSFAIVSFRFLRLITKENNVKNLIIVIALMSALIITFTYLVGEWSLMANQAKTDELVNEFKKGDLIRFTGAPTIGNTCEIQKPNLDRGAILQIDKITIELPIFNSLSHDNMFIGAAHIEGTPYYWERGNSFLAAHNTRSGNKLFNRIDDLIEGDTVRIQDSNGALNFAVYHKETVQPDDTECFNRLQGEYNLSLVTCVNQGRQRLIVYCKKK